MDRVMVMKKDTQIFNLTDCCRMVGVARNTIGRHVKAGKVSVVKDSDGRPGIQIAELIRAYGEIKHPPDGEPTGNPMDKGGYPPNDGYPHDTPGLHTNCEMAIQNLKDQNRKLEEDIRKLEADKEYFMGLLKSSILRIEDKSGGGKSKRKSKKKSKKKKK
jgi:hypothetical protein